MHTTILVARQKNNNFYPPSDLIEDNSLFSHFFRIARLKKSHSEVLQKMSLFFSCGISSRQLVQILSRLHNSSTIQGYRKIFVRLSS